MHSTGLDQSQQSCGELSAQMIFGMKQYGTCCRYSSQRAPYLLAQYASFRDTLWTRTIRKNTKYQYGKMLLVPAMSPHDSAIARSDVYVTCTLVATHGRLRSCGAAGQACCCRNAWMQARGVGDERATGRCTAAGLFDQT